MDGVRELFAQLDSLTEIEAEIYQSVDECGEFVRDDARLLAPVDAGDLRKSIDHTTQADGQGICSIVHTNSDHAVYVEFGTGPVGAANHAGTAPGVPVAYSPDKWLGKIPGLVSGADKGFRYIAGQPAQPYLYPALKDNEEQIEEKLSADISRILEGRSR
ncbi:MAG: HK97 gp10 family phage protein [Clostridium sp.]|nr:HK97 gp10 family phage protein [Clostridium sp.]